MCSYRKLLNLNQERQEAQQEADFGYQLAEPIRMNKSTARGVVIMSIVELGGLVGSDRLSG